MPKAVPPVGAPATAHVPHARSRMFAQPVAAMRAAIANDRILMLRIDFPPGRDSPGRRWNSVLARRRVTKEPQASQEAASSPPEFAWGGLTGGWSVLSNPDQEVSMRKGPTSFAFLGLATLAACGASPTDVEEIKKGQKDILAKLDNLDKTVQQLKAAAPAARPAAADPNKVYTIPVTAGQVRGPKDAKVTIGEFSDFQ